MLSTGDPRPKDTMMGTIELVPQVDMPSRPVEPRIRRVRVKPPQVPEFLRNEPNPRARFDIPSTLEPSLRVEPQVPKFAFEPHLGANMLSTLEPTSRAEPQVPELLSTVAIEPTPQVNMMSTFDLNPQIDMPSTIEPSLQVDKNTLEPTFRVERQVPQFAFEPSPQVNASIPRFRVEPQVPKPLNTTERTPQLEMMTTFELNPQINIPNPHEPSHLSDSTPSESTFQPEPQVPQYVFEPRLQINLFIPSVRVPTQVPGFLNTTEPTPEVEMVSTFELIPQIDMHMPSTIEPDHQFDDMPSTFESSFRVEPQVPESSGSSMLEPTLPIEPQPSEPVFEPYFEPEPARFTSLNPVKKVNMPVRVRAERDPAEMAAGNRRRKTLRKRG